MYLSNRIYVWYSFFWEDDVAVRMLPLIYIIWT